MLRRERDNAHPSATGSGAVAYPQSENPAQGLDAWEKKQSCAGAAEFTSDFCFASDVSLFVCHGFCSFYP